MCIDSLLCELSIESGKARVGTCTRVHVPCISVHVHLSVFVCVSGYLATWADMQLLK